MSNKSGVHVVSTSFHTYFNAYLTPHWQLHLLHFSAFPPRIENGASRSMRMMALSTMNRGAGEFLTAFAKIVVGQCCAWSAWVCWSSTQLAVPQRCCSVAYVVVSSTPDCCLRSVVPSVAWLNMSCSLDNPTAIALLLKLCTIRRMRVNYLSIGVPCLTHHSAIPKISPTQFLLSLFLACLKRLILSSSVIKDVRLDAQ